MAKEQYMVTVNRPKGVTVEDMNAYIRDALNSWWGQFQPPGYEGGEGDPRWGMKFTNVKRLNQFHEAK